MIISVRNRHKGVIPASKGAAVSGASITSSGIAIIKAPYIVAVV